MPASSEENRAGERQAETGPPPYYHRSDCNICRKQDGLKTGSQLLDYPPPGGYIVESRRHLLDFGEMNVDEFAELGPLLHRLVPAIKAATGVQRVYFLALMERAPHFHLWLVPKQEGGALQGVAYLAQQPPLTTSRSAAAAMSHAIREVFEQS
jgi:diadenosine tetraphosphate (Ap4A) HIT family hydrolase